MNKGKEKEKEEEVEDVLSKYKLDSVSSTYDLGYSADWRDEEKGNGMRSVPVNVYLHFLWHLAIAEHH